MSVPTHLLDDLGDDCYDCWWEDNKHVRDEGLIEFMRIEMGVCSFHCRAHRNMNREYSNDED